MIPRERPRRVLLAACLLASTVAAGCAMPQETAEPGMDADEDEMPMDAMGMGANTTLLAKARLDTLPQEPVAWVAYDLSALEFDDIRHTHGPAFVLAVEGTHTVPVGDGTPLEPGEAAFVPAGAEHEHQDTEGLWEIHLMEPDGDAPEDLAEAERVFASPPLEGVPEAPAELLFALVMLPPDGMTVVHQHPGPEYIYVTEGTVTYESGTTDGPVTLETGDDHALPQGTAVQKRNPSDGHAAFLSLFIVDPDEDFVQEASFEASSE